MVNYANGKSRLIEPDHGTYQDTWDEPCNSNFDVINALVSGITYINAATITSVAPTATLVFRTFPTYPDPLSDPLAGQNVCVRIYGPLTVNATILIPSGIGGFWIVDNITSGSFTVTIKTTASGSTGVTVPQGKAVLAYSDGVNVIYADNGSVADVPLATSTVPGIYTVGAAVGNCPILDAQAKIPYTADKVIISTGDPDPAQGYQNWVWYKTA